DAPDDARLGDLALLPKAERARLLALASGPERAPISEGGVLGMIEAHVRQTPDTEAVVTEAGSLTYAALWAASGRLAGHLRARGVAEGVPVGLCLPRTADLVVGMLGILRAGGAYVPLDPAHPDARLRALLADAGAAALVTTGGRTLGAEANLTVVDLDAPLADAEAPAPPSLDALAYVLYTSGSTGRPKGVPVTHRHLAHSTQARLDHYPEEVGRFLLLSSVAFDSSVAGLFWTLASGGALVLPAERQEQDVPALAALVARHGVTHTLTLPSLWRVILDLAAPDDLASLQRVILAGEALAPDVAAAHRARLGAALTNEYGPTEATVWATAHEVTTASGRVPIGRPIPGAQTYVLDGAGDLAPVSVPGELALGGDGVVDGYLGRPEATAAAFGPNPFGDGRLYRTGDRARWREDGTLDFLGRADGQVKVRGHRIELAEVEAALRAHPTVREAAASVHIPEAGGARLLGYVVGEGAEAADVKALLQRRVPDYMIPSAIVVLDALPRTRTGKLDRAALPLPEAAHTSGHVAPRTEAERALAAIWAEVLGLEAVGVTDNFFEIGGDSIASIQIISRANRAGLGLKPAQFFERPTVEALAAVAATTSEAASEAMPVGPVPLTPIQRWFFGLDLPSPSLWTQAVTVDLKAETDADRLVEAVRRVAEAHDAFRLRFAQTDDGWTQCLVESDAPRLDVATHDLADVPEAERPEAAARIWTDAQAALDIKRGPLLRLDLLGSDPRRLILTAHHLAVDVVSWQTILSQVEDAYARLGAGKDAAVTASGTPVGRWAEALEAFARSPEVEAERDVWRAQAAEAVPPLPADADGPNTERSAQTVRVGWSAAETQALTEATAAYGTNVAEMLLAALAEAVGAWAGADRVRVDLEGHGRDDLGGTVDVAQTVGWFTTVYPVTLTPAPGDPRAALIGAKEAVRAVPRQGLGYGLLRHGPEPDPRLGDGAEILVNYLGRGQAPFGAASPFVGTPDVWGAHGPGGERGHLLEVVARIADGALDVRWTFSTNRHQTETIERLARTTLETLARLVDHARAPEAGAYTPSDFPDVDLGQDALDALLGDFD
ncbi:MAG: amino acid adenylation domain-containing protein, partial [Bacteroidota bacterium]